MVQKELADLRERSAQLAAQWDTEKQAISDLRSTKESIEQTRLQIETAERQSDLEQAARLRYGTLRELEARLVEQEARLRELQAQGALLKEEVDAEEIAAVVSRWTGIPVTRLLEGEMQKLLHMEERLRQRVVGQPEALQAVANAVRRARSGLQDPDRPMGSFIFLGPTGVGKTEMARALAEFLFDDERAVVRVDMGEYQEKHTVSRLVGAPPGYIGYDEGGQLTEAVRRRPYSVVLFDEIEKAHPEVFNVLLQLLDDGRLTDGQGRTVDFKNTVVIMTSNLGGELWATSASGAAAAVRDRLARIPPGSEPHRRGGGLPPPDPGLVGIVGISSAGGSPAGRDRLPSAGHRAGRPTWRESLRYLTPGHQAGHPSERRSLAASGGRFSPGRLSW
jgi:ATP-dependent Clp protease ATP-binding subunit ClpB